VQGVGGQVGASTAIFHGKPAPFGGTRAGFELACRGEAWRRRGPRAGRSPAYGRMVTWRMICGVAGWLRAPSAPRVVGVSARASTTSKPRMTLAKIT